jgi:hypothetical protein
MSSGLRFTRRQAIVLLAGSAWTIACGRRPDAQPAAIVPGRDQCDWCHMTIDDPALAAALVTPAGTSRLFGEPGCLLAWLAHHPPTAGAQWVRIREDELWHDPRQLTLAVGLLRTPMGFNISAHGVAPAPVTGVTLTTWAELLAKGAPDARPT